MVDRVENFQSQEIRFLDQTIVLQGHISRHHLPADFQPKSWTVICGRGKVAFSHVGNQRLRILVQSKLAAYSAATSKMAKSTIVGSIVDTVRSACPEGAFVKIDSKTKRYIETGDSAAREKVGQLFREHLTKQSPEKLEQRKVARKARALKRKNKNSIPRSPSTSSVSTAETSAMSTDSDSVSSSEPQSLPMPNLVSMPSLGFAPLPMNCESRQSILFAGLQNILSL